MGEKPIDLEPGTTVEVTDRESNNFQRAMVVECPVGYSTPNETDTFVWVRYENGSIVPVREYYVRVASTSIITGTTRLATRGQTSVIVTPPLPCGLGNCVAELHVTVRHDTTRIHLDDAQRQQLIRALGGTWPA